MNRMTDGLATAKPGFLDRLIHAEAKQRPLAGDATLTRSFPRNLIGEPVLSELVAAP
jgi:hypothetical protein